MAPDARRHQIIDAVRPLYAVHAYDDVSTYQLAEAAGVTRGLINHYFDGKRDLYLAVVRASIMMPRDGLPVTTGLPLEARARLSIDWVMEAATTYGQAWVNASGSADLRGDPELQDIVDAADDRAARLVIEALGLDDSPVIRARLRAFAAMVKAMCREWLQHATVTRHEALETLTATLVLLTRDASPQKTSSA